MSVTDAMVRAAQACVGRRLITDGAMRHVLEAAEAAAWSDDMEAAPREGRILAVVNGCTRIVCWGKTSHVPMWGFCLADQGVENFDLCKPTAWRPLPQPPKGEGG